MSRKTQRNAPTPAATPAPAPKRGAKALIAIAALAVAIVGGTLAYTSSNQSSAAAAATSKLALLQRDHAPRKGEAQARVHIVEFFDPACGACAQFYPFVARLMADNPGKVQVTLRHVPFHKGADEVVKILEAARNQDRYWVVLERLLQTQEQWTVNHVVKSERVWPLLAGGPVDVERLRAEMGSPEIAARMKQDMEDARALSVTMTPEFFVNGRPLPSFGYEQLQALVGEELKKQYP